MEICRAKDADVKVMVMHIFTTEPVDFDQEARLTVVAQGLSRKCPEQKREIKFEL